MKDYSGIALTAPISFGYAKQSPKGAAWFIGRTLQLMLARAGLGKDDVDGFAVSSFSLGTDSAITLTQNFEFSPRWIEQLPYGGASGILALRRAARAIQAGDASIVACIGGDGAAHRSFEATAANFSSFTIDASFPYGGGGPNAAFGLITQRYMDEFDARREDFGAIAVAQRYNANHYPPALLGHKTLSLEQYLSARPIAGPLHLFDCVMPCAGGEGFLMMSEDRARALGLPYCTILAAGELHNAHREDDIQLRGGWTEYANQLWAMAGLGPEDVDILQTYDDYPVISMMQMEDLGFCGKGEAPQWLKTTDLRFDGSGPQQHKLAHNTSGGQLSVGQAGAAAGYMSVVETIRQLTGDTEGNQVPGARHAMVSGFGMINYDRGLCSAATILARSDR
ncbi:acetyl-CoA acetyltransferase [Kineobactrum sediminis]|uniref:Acetyl-CoA acetyltransferase n=1 Tax=Kineobactrum sediminis TaxID=1905677 RepID=A0A2N5Y1X9_9GAMM|nr:thiolase family protein [Kineobactrum sediminis]PLW82396.1 acetyl-CoA acetyltransferase [Kineobactrum sediminis]